MTSTATREVTYKVTRKTAEAIAAARRLSDEARAAEVAMHAAIAADVPEWDDLRQSGADARVTLALSAGTVVGVLSPVRQFDAALAAEVLTPAQIKEARAAAPLHSGTVRALNLPAVYAACCVDGTPRFSKKN